MRRRCLWFCACLSLIACSRAAPSSTPRAAVDVASAKQESNGAAQGEPGARGYLAWGYHKEQLVSRWYSLERGHVVEAGSAPAVMIADGDTVWRIDHQETKLELPSCAVILGTTGPDDSKGEGTLTQVWAQELGGARRHMLVSAERPEGATEYQHSVRMLGSVGTLLFLEESEYDYSCGAHGGTSKGFVAADVKSGFNTDVLTPTERSKIDRAEGVLARRWFLGEGVFPEDDGDGVELVRLVPHYVRGALTVDALFAAPTCYACSDGEWSSYTTTKSIELAVIPARLREGSRLPASLQAELEELDVRGFSRLSKANLDRLSQPQP
ncbi:MAG: hypothetical protein R3B13_27025 [Polyangiaceae bacterium]